MKFLCIPCDQVMDFVERQLPGDGTLAAVFVCDACGNEIAMLTNPMETQLVSSLGVKIGGRAVPEQPLEQTRSTLEGGRTDAFQDDSGDSSRATAAVPAGPDGPGTPGRVHWDDEAVARLQRVPAFVRGMVKRIYADWAVEHGVKTITPAIMDRARAELGLEGM